MRIYRSIGRIYRSIGGSIGKGVEGKREEDLEVDDVEMEVDVM